MSLGANFYKNYIFEGDVEPLRVEISLKSDESLKINDVFDNKIIRQVLFPCESDIYTYKPLLRTVESLSDDELVYIATGKDDELSMCQYYVSGSEQWRHVYNSKHDFEIMSFDFGEEFGMLMSVYSIEWQDILNRIYELKVDIWGYIKQGCAYDAGGVYGG